MIKKILQEYEQDFPGHQRERSLCYQFWQQKTVLSLFGIYFLSLDCWMPIWMVHRSFQCRWMVVTNFRVDGSGWELFFTVGSSLEVNNRGISSCWFYLFRENTKRKNKRADWDTPDKLFFLWSVQKVWSSTRSSQNASYCKFRKFQETLRFQVPTKLGK